jgi:uncharacterized protein DUF4232
MAAGGCYKTVLRVIGCPAALLIGACSGSESTTARACQVDDLLLAAASEEGATGHGLTIIAVISQGTATCVLSGTPSVTLTSRAGDLRVQADPKGGGGFMLGAQPATRVSLRPNEAAYFGIETIHICPPNGDGALRRADFADVSINKAFVNSLAVSISLCADAAVGPFRATVPAVFGR